MRIGCSPGPGGGWWWAPAIASRNWVVCQSVSISAFIIQRSNSRELTFFACCVVWVEVGVEIFFVTRRCGRFALGELCFVFAGFLARKAKLFARGLQFCLAGGAYSNITYLLCIPTVHTYITYILAYSLIIKPGQPASLYIHPNPISPTHLHPAASST